MQGSTKTAGRRRRAAGRCCRRWSRGSQLAARGVVGSRCRGRQGNLPARKAGVAGRRAQLQNQVRRAAESRAARRRDASRRPAAGRGGCGIGQDAHADLSRRAADRERRAAGRDPAADVHAPRRAGDAAARRATGRRSRGRRRGRHLSFVRQQCAAAAWARRWASSPTSRFSIAPTWRTWSICCGRGWDSRRASAGSRRRARSPKRSAWRATSGARSKRKSRSTFRISASIRRKFSSSRKITRATSASAGCSTTTTCSIGWRSCSNSTRTCGGGCRTAIATS